jgi:hypothetical protein
MTDNERNDNERSTTPDGSADESEGSSHSSAPASEAGSADSAEEVTFKLPPMGPQFI